MVLVYYSIANEGGKCYAYGTHPLGSTLLVYSIYPMDGIGYTIL